MMSDPIVIRPLGPADAALYRPVRLAAVIAHPDAFGASPADEPPDDAGMRARLEQMAADPRVGLLGALLDGRLVGTAGWVRARFVKEAHKASIWGMYVDPTCRGRGLGKRLLSAVCDRLRAAGVERVNLQVSGGNDGAIGLYRQAGFTVWGREPDAMRVAGPDGPVSIEGVFMSLTLMHRT